MIPLLFFSVTKNNKYLIQIYFNWQNFLLEPTNHNISVSFFKGFS